jgi:hypothetical protein
MIRRVRWARFSRSNAFIHRASRQLLRVEELETRVVPSSNRLDALFAQPFAGRPNFTPAMAPFTPSQIRHAYGIDQIAFGSVQGDGSGQTIAIIDAYNAPYIRSDLATFDSTFRLPAPPSFNIINQSGGTRLPRNNSGWSLEASLDVEWAHATAPKADLLLVEASTNSFSNLFAAAATAANEPRVSVVSMSFGGSEFSSETSYDSVFTTPSGHQGVSFVASAGDSGAPAQYPSASPNVLSVGGTSLSIDSAGNYISEVGWSNSYGASGGGLSAIEPEPSYQAGVQNMGARGTPDVSLVADPNTGVYVYDTYGYSGWLQVGGTSLSAPVWAGLISIANQGRTINRVGTLSNVHADLYSLPASDFHDIRSGNNGYTAKTGYDFMTGLGTPLANLVVPALASTTLPKVAVHSSTVHNLLSVKKTSPVQSPANATALVTATIFTATQPGTAAVAVTPTVGATSVTDATTRAQVLGQLSSLFTSPASASVRVRASEPTLELAHTLPDNAIDGAMPTEDILPSNPLRTAAAETEARLPALPSAGPFAGESFTSSPEGSDFFFSSQTSDGPVLTPAFTTQTTEEVSEALEPAAVIGLAFLLGGSWRSWAEEPDSRRRRFLQA